MGFNINSRLSGGSSQSDPNLSLGGAMSSVEVEQQAINYVSGGVTGITINRAWGFDEGRTYNLEYSNSNIILTDDLLNTASLSTSGGAGDYILNLPNSNTGIQLYFSNPSTMSKDFTVTNAGTNLFTDATPQESTSGFTEYRCIYLQNDGDLTTYIDLSLPLFGVLESFSVGFDSGGVDATAVTISDEFTAPSGVAFSAPTSGSPLEVTLLIGEKIAVWIKRQLDPNNLYSKYPSEFQILVALSDV